MAACNINAQVKCSLDMRVVCHHVCEYALSYFQQKLTVQDVRCKTWKIMKYF